MSEADGMERVGFVGAGTMGHGMCSCLMKAGHPLTVIANRNRAPINDLVLNGAKEAETLAALAKASDVIILCVSNSAVVEEVLAELLPDLSDEQLVIDTGTSKPESTRAVADKLAEHGIDFADAALIFEVDLALTKRAPEIGGEIRYMTLGEDPYGDLLVVVYTWRDERIRLISARRATGQERRQYECKGVG